MPLVTYPNRICSKHQSIFSEHYATLKAEETIIAREPDESCQTGRAHDRTGLGIALHLNLYDESKCYYTGAGVNWHAKHRQWLSMGNVTDERMHRMPSEQVERNTTLLK